jgi:peptide/nickel transport system substrate-binding protein
MTITYDISPDAVWSDGTPITAADFVCTWNAYLNTPGSWQTVGFDQIISVEQGASDKQAVVEFSSTYAPYKGLFNPIIPAHVVTDPTCMDVSADFADLYPVSGRPWMMESWNAEQAIFVPNPNYWGDDPAGYSRLIQVPRAPDVETTALTSGEVDFIFPQAFAGITEALAADNITFVAGYGTNYEGLYFQQGADRNGPFADPVFRQAFSMSVDREFILQNIYIPIFPGSELLQCAQWVPTIGDWCQNDQFTDSFDPEGAATVLTDAGWAKNADGMWAKPDGTVPEIKWRINAGNTRRESTQALMIPEFQKLGFNVVADNPEGTTMFQETLPSGDYDLAMYISTATPDPSVTANFSCTAVPSAENNNSGSNSVFWCNEEASALMQESDITVDEAARVELIHQIGQMFVDDYVELPLFQFPNIAAWRTDRIEGDTPGSNAANYRAYNHNSSTWVPIGDAAARGDGGEIIVGAEQWAECINPVTSCANSSWMQWSVSGPILPGVWDTTNDGTFELTNMMASEPVVTVNE